MYRHRRGAGWVQTRGETHVRARAVAGNSCGDVRARELLASTPRPRPLRETASRHIAAVGLKARGGRDLTENAGLELWTMVGPGPGTGGGGWK